MKFSKTLFFAAASLFAGTAISATAAVTAVTINTGDTISAKERIDGGFWSSRDIRLSGTGGTLSVDTDYLYVRENITGYGQLIDLIPGTGITWAGLLVGDRLNRWTGPWANASSYYQGAIVTTLGGALAISAGIPAWSSGEIVINEGKSLSVKSQINTWLGYGTLNNTLGLTSRMAGASVTMKAGSSLNFADYDASSNPAPGSNSLIQYLYNVKSDGDSATTTLMTRSGAGSQSFYVNIHIDDAVNGGSLGKIVGSASIIKSGAGTLKLLGESTEYASSGNTNSANVFVTRGTLLLGAAETMGGSGTTVYDTKRVLEAYCNDAGIDFSFGQTLYAANSINIAGDTSIPAATYGELELTGTGTTATGEELIWAAYRGALIETPEASSLVIQNNQVIKNLQSMFANGTAASDDNKSIESAIHNAEYATSNPVVVGAGEGSMIGIAAGSILAVNQEAGRGGIYKGSLVGLDADGNASSTVRGGTFVKYGAGDLALMLEAANITNLVVLEGRLICNIRTLNLGADGVGGVRLYDGSLVTVVENETVTLRQTLSTESGSDFEFATYAYAETLGGPIDVSNQRAAGTVEFDRAQDIYGNVIVHSGITLLPAGNLSNIESIVLVGAAESLNESTSGIESRLATVDFGNKSQVLNNLIGDTYSRLKTGTASRIELAIDEGNYTGELDLSAVNYGIFGTFGGRIEGYGNIVKSGAGTLNLTGSLGAATNYGALVIKQGALVGGTAQILGNASALILNTDTTASFVGDQSLVALYGVAGTSVTLADETGAAGNLLLGESVSRRSELPNVSNPATNYLSLADDRTLYAGQTDVTVAFKPFLELAGAGTELYEALEKFAQSSPMSVSQYDLVRDLFGDSALTSVATLTERHLTTAYLNLLNANGDLDSAEAQFAGDVVANTIIKIGASEQSLLGKITASAIRVEGGKLTIGGDSLQNETALEVNRGAEISIVVAGANSTNAVTINGDGDIRILSDVDLDLSSQFANTTTGAITLVGTHPTETVEFSMALRNATLSLGAQGDITVENANLALNQTSNVDWSNSLVVDGDLIKQGSGKLTLTSNNSSVTGTVSVEEGELDLVGWENAGAATYGALDVAAGATLNLNVATATNFAGTTNGAGTIVKSGSDTLTLTGAAGTFAGTLSIDAGSLVVATANYFDAATTVSVASGAQLTLNSDQKFASLDGAGTISLAASVTLTLAFDDASTAIVIDNSSGHYVATIPTAYVGSFTGALAGGASSAIAVGGTGAFDFSAATIAAGIAINVSDGQLVLPAAAANSDSVTVTDGELVYSVLAGATDNLGNVVQLPLNIGKVGAGTLALSSSQIANTAIAVYEGALTVSGSDVFSFNTLKLAQGTTLNISYSGSDSDIDLSKIEGSGTVVFTNTGTAFSSLDLGGMSMLPTTGTRYFNGSIRFEGVNLVVGNDVTVTALGLDAASNLQVNNNATLTITQSDNTALAGAVTIQDGSEICVTSLRDGNGDYYVLSLTNDSISGDIRVKNGALQLNQSENLAGGTLTAQGSADLYFNVPSGSVAPTTLTNANVDVSLATSVRFIKTGAGTMKLDGASPAAFAKVSWTPLSPMAAGGSTPSVPTILGVNEGQLILNNVDRMASNIGLATYAAGTLVLDGAQTLDRSVSGDGAVEKRGAGVLTVASNQAFTGAFTLSAGTTVFADNPTLATSQLILAGSAKASGAVTLTDAGTTSALAIAAGAKYSLAADETIAYAGTLNVADINGTIEVTGTSSATPIVLLQATTAQGDLSVAAQRALANRISLNMAGANRFMLSQSAGTVTLYTVGSSLSSSLNLHDGLDGFVGLLDAALPAGNVVEADLTDSLLVSLLRSGTASAGTAIENLSPLSYSAMVVMSRTGHNNDINQFRDRATARRFELANDYADIGWQFWVTAQGSFVKSGSGHNAAVYDYNVYGALVGADIKLDDYTLMGVGLGCDYGVANIHNGGGKIKSDDYRLTIYGSSLLGDGSWFADYGVSGAFSSYDIKRKTLVGNAESEPDGYSLGAYGILGRGILLSVDRDERLILTPYAGLSVYYTKVGAEKETGGAGLDIDDISAWSVRGLLGASLDWVFPCGDYDARLGLDATFAHEFADDEIDLDTTYSGKKCTVQSAGGSTNTLSIGPSAALSLGLHTSIRMAYRLEVGVDEDVAHNVNFGFRHSF